jgi:hypothetical protein
LRHHFDSSAELYAHALVKILNQDFLLGFAWLLQFFSIALRFCLAHVHFGAAYYSLLISSEVRVFAGFSHMEELHERLEEHGELLQARCRGGKSNCSIANNFSGNTFPDAKDYSKYIAPWPHGIIDLFGCRTRNGAVKACCRLVG